MNKETLHHNGKDVIRINKIQAKRAYQKGETIFMIASNLRPCFAEEGFDNPMCFLSEVKGELNRKEYQWNNLLFMFRYYNCTKETGRYIKFYKYKNG